MPSSAEEYRAKARECAKLAAKTNDPKASGCWNKQLGSGLRSLTVLKSTVLREQVGRRSPGISLTRGGSDRGAPSQPCGPSV
jgi:hypothetical protein